MLRHAVLAIIAFAAITPATAADMPQRRIGEIFAEPAEVLYPVPGPLVVVRTDAHVLLLPRKVPGYYGTPTSFQQRTYYGTTKSFLSDYFPVPCSLLKVC